MDITLCVCEGERRLVSGGGGGVGLWWSPVCVGVWIDVGQCNDPRRHTHTQTIFHLARMVAGSI